MRFAILTLAFAAALAAEAPVPVRLQGAEIVEPLVLAHATATAARMFATVGVQIEWSRSKPQPGELVILLAPRRNAPASRDAVAHARPYASGGVAITIFYEDVLSVAGRATQPQSALMAHVLVHEITHVLQRVARHSQSGVMRARWSRDDLNAMQRRPLPFDPADADLLRAVR
jgi:hypothetical protein